MQYDAIVDNDNVAGSKLMALVVEGRKMNLLMEGVVLVVVM